MKPTSVYIIECAGRVKIGKAVDVTVRLRALSTGAPHEVRLIYSREFETSEAAFHIETRMHRFFYRERVKGEWFEIDPERAVEFLKNVKPLGPRRRTRAHRSDNRPVPETMELMRDALNRMTPRT